ncbi:hypothetical protein [Niabella ginsengisoli]|uniref:Uncharacterized protein n=1 Tax=Niabella ginsengisoli TaxID=522298 RepID=A0ABS9SRF6_9BACT|nr:hypothetical protein [Niabella ginsengisoli]MCH5600947.1 hypothetical protein [Niabella ginsengisoli]
MLSTGVILPGLIGANPINGLNNPGDSFIDRLLPAPVGGGFMMNDYWIWDPQL